MRNFLEHEDKVKFMDNYLAHNQDWQWFFDLIEKDFDADDIESFDEFIKRKNYYIDVYERLRMIIEIPNIRAEFKNALFTDLYNIALYNKGKLLRENCQKNIITCFGQIFFLMVWITNIENNSNDTNYICNFSFFTHNNYWEFINMNGFEYDDEDIIEFANSIDCAAFSNAVKCIANNINRIHFPVRSDFIEKYKSYLLNVNAFCYSKPQVLEELSWQEDLLLDMLQVSFRHKEITPLFASYPDYSKWTSDLICDLKKYFDSPVANFILETMNYINNGVIPSNDVILKHFELWIDSVNDYKDEIDIVTSSSYAVVSFLYTNGHAQCVSKEKTTHRMIKVIQEVTSLNIIGYFINDRLPVSKKQKNDYKEYIVNQYKSIDDFEDIYSLNHYLGNNQIAKSITEEYLLKVVNLFMSISEITDDPLVSSLFYNMMVFLISINETNTNIDKQIIHNIAISIQELWSSKIYYKMVSKMHCYEYSTSLPTEEIEKYNEQIINHPTILAKSCVISNKESIINIMQCMSENPLSHMVTKMEIEYIYPIKKTNTVFKKPLDDMYKSLVTDVKNKFAYKFQNQFDENEIVSAIYERINQNAILLIPMFNDVESLYSLVNDRMSIKLLPYTNEITLGHITQLFPILESEIRKLGKFFNVIPFKFNTKEFMKMKDPSSVLKEILELLYAMVDGLDYATDILFVYCLMYNGNSLNIRNECIHGRDYIQGTQLNFGFKVTLLSLYMIIHRIELIENEISKNE